MTDAIRIPAEWDARWFASILKTLRSMANAWPIGAVFTSTTNENPVTLLGFGTWEAFGSGRVLVGLKSDDTDFDVLAETGGAKTVAAAGTLSGSSASNTTGATVAAHASHTHTVPATGTAGVAIGAGANDAAALTHTHTTDGPDAPLTHSVTDPGHTHGAGTLAFAGSATSVVQPYIVVRFWKRIA